MQHKDYYKILGISKSADTSEIKAAYRRLALKYHPDKKEGSEERFNEISKAYDILADLEKRKIYDRGNLNPLLWYINRMNYRPEPSLVTVFVDKRVIDPEDIIRVTFTLNGQGTILGINGLQNFAIVSGPITSTGLNEYGGNFSLLTRYSYLLRPLKTGYLDIGPANVFVNGKQVMSNYLSVKVSRKVPDVIVNWSKSREKKMMSGAIITIIAAILIIHLFFTPDAAEEVIAQRNSKNYNITSGNDYVNPSVYNQLSTGDSPYKDFLGEGNFDMKSYNMIRFFNGEYADVVVCLAQESDDKIIRNTYIKAGTAYVMENIPDGNYYMRLLSGVDWNPEIKLLDGRIRGGFNKYFTFKIFKNPENIFRMKQIDREGYANYSAYEITLQPVTGGNMKGETAGADQFFN